MPKEPRLQYFVKIIAREPALHDPGEGFADLYEACTHAVELASDFFTRYPQRVKDAILPLAVEVVDATGAIIFRSPVR